MEAIDIGEIILFGGYKWRVLDTKADAALIITEDMIGQHPYHDKSGDISWADSAIRKYLNGEFYGRFPAADQSKIMPIVNKNSGNQWYGSNGGEDTQDYIFLLSIEEAVCKYFGDSCKNLKNRSPKQRYWFQKKDENNIRRRAIFDGRGWWWWLRSPGRDNKRAVYIHGDGNIGIQGNKTFKYSSTTLHSSTGDNSGGVRPALWLKF